MADRLANTIPFVAINASIAAPQHAKVTPDLSDGYGSDVSSLSRAIVDGNEEAFGRFYDQYHGRVYGLLLVLVSGREELARELHQQAMIKIARKFRAFDSEPQLWAWLSEVARNVFRDYLRTESRRLKRNLSAGLNGAEESPSQTDGHLLEWLEEALKELDSEERLLIDAAYFENRPQAEIARANKQTIKAVESKLARTRAKIRAFIVRKTRYES
jgi:RNA polymerase sigma-70 factor (ECF subfamily)